MEGLTCKDLFPHTYRISAPQHRELYVAEVTSVMGIDYFHLVLYDPPTGTVTQNPPRIWAKWTQGCGAKDPLLKTPYVSFADLFNNHHDQIVFEERVHNGTMYNAVVYRYFDVGTDLALTPILVRETRLLARTRRSVRARPYSALRYTSSTRHIRHFAQRSGESQRARVRDSRELWLEYSASRCREPSRQSTWVRLFGHMRP